MFRLNSNKVISFNNIFQSSTNPFILNTITQDQILKCQYSNLHDINKLNHEELLNFHWRTLNKNANTIFQTKLLNSKPIIISNSYSNSILNSIGTKQTKRYFYNFTLKSRLGPRLPKYVEHSEEAPIYPSLDEVQRSVVKQIQNWKFWNKYNTLDRKLKEDELLKACLSEEEIIQRRKDIVKEFLAEIRDEFGCIKPDPARIFGIPQFLVTALRRFDTSPIQTDVFISPVEQAKCFGQYNKHEIILPIHQRDSFLLPDFFGAFHDYIDVEERKEFRKISSLNRNFFDNLRKRLKKQDPAMQFAVDSMEDNEIPKESIFYEYQKKLARFKAVNPLEIKLTIDRLGSGKFYEIMKEGSENYTIICSKDAIYDGSFQKFTVDRTISSWISNLYRFPNDAHKNAEIERSIAIFFLSRFIHLYYFNRKFRNTKPYDYLTSQYGLGSYSKRILYETCAEGLEMVPYSTITGMINEVIYGMREEGKTISLAIYDSHEFSHIDRDKLISRDGEKTDLLSKMIEVATDLDIDKLLVSGAEANIPKIKKAVDNCLTREIEILFEKNQPLLEDGKKFMQLLSNLNGCKVVEGEFKRNATLPSTYTWDQSITSLQNDSFLRFKLYRTRPWIPSMIIHDLSQSGTLAPKPDKNIFLKQSLYHTYYELMNIIKSKIQLSVHKSFYQEHLKEILLRIYISLFLFPSDTCVLDNLEKDLDLVIVGLFPPNIDSYVQGQKQVRVIGEPVSFEALKMAIQDDGFIPNINETLKNVLFRDFYKSGLISREEAFMFHFLNNDPEKLSFVEDIFTNSQFSQSSLQSIQSNHAKWLKNIYFTPELLIDGKNSNITDDEYWSGVLDMARKKETQIFQVGDRDLPGLDGNIEDTRLYHSNLGAISIQNLIFKLQNSNNYCWFTEHEEKLYGVIFGFNNLDENSISKILGNYENSISEKLGGLLMIKINLSTEEAIKLPQFAKLESKLVK